MISEELVVDDRAAFLVPQRRHRHASGIFRIGEQVDLPQLLRAVDGVGERAGLVREPPGPLAIERRRDGDRDRVLELLELAEQCRAVGPRAGMRDIEVVAAGRGGKAAFAARAGAAVGGDPVAEHRRPAHEAPALVPVGLGVLVPDAFDEKSHFSGPSWIALSRASRGGLQAASHSALTLGNASLPCCMRAGLVVSPHFTTASAKAGRCLMRASQSLSFGRSSNSAVS